MFDKIDRILDKPHHSYHDESSQPREDPAVKEMGSQRTSTVWVYICRNKLRTLLNWSDFCK